MATFDSALYAAFQSSLKGHRRVGEIVAFKALAESFEAVSKDYLVDVYHGARSRVRFHASSHWRVGAGCCELADLLLVTLRSMPRSEIRITFVQCKREPGYVTKAAITKAGATLAGNYEQWDLLANRPMITPLGTIRPPKNILADAVLASVGSFVFFHQPSKRAPWDLVYSSADNLFRTSPPKRFGPLQLRSAKGRRRIGLRWECVAGTSLVDWARHIGRGHVGSPIVYSKSGANNAASRDVLAWLGAVLRSVIKQRRGNSRNEVATAILAQIDGLDLPAANAVVPARAVVLLLSNGSAVVRRNR